MQRWWSLFSILMFGLMVLVPSLLLAQPALFSKEVLLPDEQNNIDVFKKQSHAVVYVTRKSLRQDFFSFNVLEIPAGAGSGFVWSKQGYIVTNFHVIAEADRLEITLYDQSQWEAKVVGVAPEKDLAVLKIDAPKERLEPVVLGDSTTLAVGRKVLAIGNPFGLDTTLTVGVVSALGREIKAQNGRTIRDVIQTDAAINPGNSGGPLLNAASELVGVNTAIFSPSGASNGIGFAIPANTVARIVPELIKHGRIIRPVMGIEIVPDYWRQRYGIVGVPILTVTANMPAAKAGLIGFRRDRAGNTLLGDIIIGIDGNTVRDGDELLSRLERYQPGDSVEVTVKRENEIITLPIILVLPPS